MVCYPALMFLLIEDEDVSYTVGWGLIAIIIANIGVNVIVMVVMSARMVWGKCRGKCSKVQVQAKK